MSSLGAATGRDDSGRERGRSYHHVSFFGGTLMCANANVRDAHRMIESYLTLVDEKLGPDAETEAA